LEPFYLWGAYGRGDSWTGIKGVELWVFELQGDKISYLEICAQNDGQPNRQNGRQEGNEKRRNLRQGSCSKSL
jgi:hypothetical protein